MNRIILIGNGFDCAHGLYTRYSDFIDWFWEEQRKKINRTNSDKWEPVSNNEENTHYKYEQNVFFDVKFYEPEKTNITDFDVKEKPTCEKDSDLKSNLDRENKSNAEREQKDKFKNAAELKNNVVYKNKFLELIEKKKKIQNWVDIEELYFEILTNCKDRKEQSENVYEIYTVEQLNRDFRNIKFQLVEFIKTRNEEIAKTDSDFRKNLTKEGEIVEKVKGLITQENPKEILWLNFNYSNTVSELYDKQYPELISIHGSINDENNPMIFGYGDETSKDSIAIEELNDNDFLENVKSIKYVETDNYSDLLKFIDKGEYDVFVFGHSCGNSDRTLLKELFESENCKAIKCFYYKKSEKDDDFNKTVDNIYRKFENKTVFRKKILKKDKQSGDFPQFKGGSPFKPKDVTNNVSELKTGISKETTLQEIITKEERLQSYLTDYNMIKVEFDSNADAYKNINGREVASKKNLRKDFYIGKYQVTQKEWREIMGDNPSFFSKNGEGKNMIKSLEVSDKLPIECVSWYDCVLFCNKLSEKYDLRKYYNVNGDNVTFNVDADGFRLPTEAEWEYAARGGKESKNYKYSGGNTADEVAWYHENSGDKQLKKEDWKNGKTKENNCRTQEVGTRIGNELGIHDMSGNVWEWCEDLYGNGSFRMLRGGCWFLNDERCLVSDCLTYQSSERLNFIGFRLVCPLLTATTM